MNLQTYRQLIHFAGFRDYAEALHTRVELEGMAMPVILNSPLRNPEDLVRMIHMVYAWMPRMLRSFNENIDTIDFEKLYRLARQARRQTISEKGENELYIGLASLTNNHMVGASKVLTILNHRVYPIFDSRVVNSWNIFFEEHSQIEPLYNYRVDKQELMVANYRYYKNSLQTWANRIHGNVRDIEFLFWYAENDEV